MTHRVVWQSFAKIGPWTSKNLWWEKKIKHGQNITVFSYRCRDTRETVMTT